MELLSHAICGSGLVRSQNQDNLFINGIYRYDLKDSSDFRYADISDNCGIYAVSDGMGGEKYGELAALIAVQRMSAINISDGSQSMVSYINECNSIICELMLERNVRIGATFVGLCIFEGRADVVNIGDSRLYIFRNGELTQLSRDHTSIQQMLDLGVITEEVAEKHPDRNKLTQHLGILPTEMIIEPHTDSIDIETGDIFLLCSDGLTEMLDTAEIKAILEASITIEKKAKSLFNAAMRYGGKDNTTLILVHVRK